MEKTKKADCSFVMIYDSILWKYDRCAKVIAHFFTFTLSGQIFVLGYSTFLIVLGNLFFILSNSIFNI